MDRNVELIRWRNYFLRKVKYRVNVPGLTYKIPRGKSINVKTKGEYYGWCISKR